MVGKVDLFKICFKVIVKFMYILLRKKNLKYKFLLCKYILFLNFLFLFFCLIKIFFVFNWVIDNEIVYICVYDY